jgi:hypothetical protein
MLLVRYVLLQTLIFCFMPGGVGQMDSFDPKPKLAELDGQAAVLDNYVAGPKRKWLKSPWTFRQHGQSGLPVSEIFPHIASVADELTVIRSMKSEFPLHARANVFLHTGRNFGGFTEFGFVGELRAGEREQEPAGLSAAEPRGQPAGRVGDISNGFCRRRTRRWGCGRRGAGGQLVPAGAALQSAKMAAVRAQDKEFLAATGNADAVEAAIGNFESWHTGCRRWRRMC